ncbi:MAG TPA: hypothetical protein VFB59_05975 [Candidatus Saccharimonadales bacterium]|nr:hypothetical protein [Candidatus Saccharimonadales bacterium]
MEKATNATPKRPRLYEHAKESPLGLMTFLIISGMALRLAVQRERNQQLRVVRKQMLLNRWRQLSGDLLRSPFGSQVTL